MLKIILDRLNQYLLAGACLWLAFISSSLNAADDPRPDERGGDLC